MKSTSSNLWLGTGTISRGAYFFWGAGLAVAKLNLDRLLAFTFSGHSWNEFIRDATGLYLWQSVPQDVDPRLGLAFLLASAPFLWAGVVLTLARLQSLGWKPWWMLLFFVPVVKLFFFGLLCLLPARADSPCAAPDSRDSSGRLGRLIHESRFGSAAMAVAVSAAFTLALVFLGTSVLRDYGWSLFVGLPFCMGFLAALLYSYHQPRGIGECLGVANLAALFAGAGLLALALEGGICILMAAPIAVVMASAGGVIGSVVQGAIWRRQESARVFCLALLVTPVAMFSEHATPPALPIIEVTSSVEIDAPPEKVWHHVVTFDELPPPSEWILKMGVAYPVRAEIRGHGVGAIRHCVFSTGPFVEPITVWDEPRKLAFSVTHNPEPMQEWTPYHTVHPAHLEGYFQSTAGQFHLVPLPEGRTRLEGTTWYHHHLWPAKYWQIWSDYVIHVIHLRVLNHVKNLAEINSSR